jgi:tetratricopeptide (TPR) repeat protein
MKLLLLATITLFSFSVSAQETVVDSAKTKIEKYYNTGITDSARAVYKAGIDHMDKYIAQDSVNPEAYLQRGIYYSFLGLSVAAIEDYDKALTLDDKQPIAYFNRGIAKARFRYTYEACYDFKRSYLLGVNQAAKVYTANCRLYQKKIDSEISKN